MLSVVSFLSSTMTYTYLYILFTSLFISSFHYLPFLSICVLMMMMYDLKLHSASISSATYRLHRLITVNHKINNESGFHRCTRDC